MSTLFSKDKNRTAIQHALLIMTMSIYNQHTCKRNFFSTHNLMPCVKRILCCRVKTTQGVIIIDRKMWTHDSHSKINDSQRDAKWKIQMNSTYRYWYILEGWSAYISSSCSSSSPQNCYTLNDKSRNEPTSSILPHSKSIVLLPALLCIEHLKRT